MECQAPRRLSQELATEMTLFELDGNLCLLMDSAAEAAAENNGKIPEELKQAVLDYCEAFGTKVDNIANYIKSQENEIRNAKTEIDRLQSRQSAAECKVESLKGLLKYFMQSRNLTSMKGRLNTVSLRKNSQDSLIVERPERVPPEYWQVTITIGLLELQDLVKQLPDGCPLQARLTPDNNGLVKSEPDNAKLRATLATGASIEGATLRRGHHLRLT